MARFRLVSIFLFLSLTLMACNFTNMISGNQEEPEIDVTPETSMDSVSEGEMNLEVDQEESMNDNQEEQTTEPMDSSQGSFTNAASTACDHPYFPMREGSTWVYFEPEESYYHHWEVLSVEGDAQNASALMVSHVGEFSELTEEAKLDAIRIEYNWMCSAEEGIVSFDLAVLEVPQMEGIELEMTMTFEEGEGVILPPAHLLEPGYSWEMSLKMNFAMPALMDAEGTMLSRDFYIVTNNDPVEFNGQEFEGLQYEREFETEMEFFLGGVASNMQNEFLNINTVTTMGKGVGFITLDSDTTLGSTGLELVSFFIP
ncbi:MAG TPA: hypothetical protein VK856_12065 [Anaerolineaceae bacterium]|nr:hypothetical protein [Anaerolineaceae bacterium]